MGSVDLRIVKLDVVGLGWVFSCRGHRPRTPLVLDVEDPARLPELSPQRRLFSFLTERRGLEDLLVYPSHHTNGDTTPLSRLHVRVILYRTRGSTDSLIRPHELSGPVSIYGTKTTLPATGFVKPNNLISLRIHLLSQELLLLTNRYDKR